MVDRERLVKLFTDLVQIDSLSLRERAMADRLKRELSEIGCEVREDDGGKAAGGDAGNVIATFRGRGRRGRPILFSAHMDRVTPGEGIRPVVEGNTIRSSGGTILGADDAAGLAAILESLRVLKASEDDHADIEVVFSFGEEKGLLGAKALDLSSIRSKSAYVLDASGPVGKVVVQAPSQVTFNAVVTGRAAHAGMEPEKGIDAIQVSSHAIAAMKLGRIDEQTTANIGIIAGGKATNIVCDRVSLEGEVRSRDNDRMYAHLGHIRSTFERVCGQWGAGIDFTHTVEYVTYKVSEQSETCGRLERVARGIGIDVEFVSAGGGSDANVFNQRGIEAVVLGAGYVDPHTLTERLDIDELVKVVTVLVGLARAS